MSYYYTTFAGVSLPLYQPSQEAGPGEFASPILSLPGGGVYDPTGDGIVRPGLRQVRVEGILLGEADRPAVFAGNYKALRALVGKRGTLTRVEVEDPDSSSTITARCRAVNTSQNADWDLQVPVSLEFDLLSPVWSGTARSVTVSPAGGQPYNFVVTNGGNREVNDAVITITAGAAPLTSVSLYRDAVCYFTWNGTLAATKSLVIDCGARSVKNDGADAYSGFTLSADWHFTCDWLPIADGANTIFCYWTGGGNFTVTVAFEDGWA